METMVTELLELERLRSRRGLSKQNEDQCPLCAVAETFGRRSPGVRVSTNPDSITMSVDAEKIANLSEPFFRITRSRSKTTGG